MSRQEASGPRDSAIWFPSKPLVVYCLLIIVVYFFFFPGFFGDHAYDSRLNLMLDDGFTPRYTISSIFSTARFHSEVGILSWRPVASVTFVVLEDRLFSNFAPFSRAVDLWLHATTAFFLWLLLRTRLDLENRSALLAAIFFAVHPLVSEVVLCTGFRFDNLALLFVMAGLLVVTSTLNQSMRHCLYALTVLLALGSKEIGIILLFLGPLLCVLLGRWRDAWIASGVGLAVTILFLYFWRMFQYPNYPSDFLGGGGRFLGIANFLVSAGEIYFPRIFLPIVLRIDHEFLPVRTWSSPRLFFGLLAFLIVLIGLIFGAINWKKKPGIFLGFFWVLVAFGPISQITPVPDPVAERFCYVPFIGVAILAALLIEKLPARKSTNVVLILVLASLGARSTVRALDWQDDRTLNIANWQDSPRPTEKSTRSLSALYLMLPPEYVSIRIAGADALAKAGEQLDLLARLAPDDPEGWRLRAIWHLRSGDVADAKAAYDRAKYLGLSFADTDPLHQKFETLRSDEN